MDIFRPLLMGFTWFLMVLLSDGLALASSSSPMNSTENFASPEIVLAEELWHHEARSQNTSTRFSRNQTAQERAPIPESEQTEVVDVTPDPLEPVNRVFFYFNDKFYFWLLKPIATGYKAVVPEPLRINVRNFFSNLTTPIRAANCLFQGKLDAFGTELARFTVNTTIGLAGFMDIAREAVKLEEQDEDLGQTFGFYGIGNGLYINWPILGPSTVRDTIGSAGDFFLNPVNYLPDTLKRWAWIRGLDAVNKTSLTLGEYESLKRAALDPYVALRDAYLQFRRNQIKE